MAEPKERIVVLVDMDCFYCQVEQRAQPELKGKPVAVVQYNQWKGGGIIAVNYEARAKGVTRHMRGDQAKEKCPEITCVHVPSKNGKADISKYREAGREVLNVICQFSSLVQSASIDEAFLDLTDAVEKRIKDNLNIAPEDLPHTYIVGYGANPDEDERQKMLKEWLRQVSQSSNEHERNLMVAAKIVQEMRAEILKQTGFTCSAGIAHNKILSKLVCGMNKPNKQTVLTIAQVPFLYQTLSVKKVRHLGGKLGDELVERLGINFMWELEKFSEAELCQKFDVKNGLWLYNIARGIDNEPVEAKLIPKSIGCCKRFPGKMALATKKSIEHWVNELANEITIRLEKDYEENNRRPKNMVVQWSHGVREMKSKTGVMTRYDQPSIVSQAMLLLSTSNDMTQDVMSNPLQFLGINVGKFTDAPSTNQSIAKFFQNDAAPKLECKPRAPVKEEKSVAAGKISSFFLQRPKTKKSPLKVAPPKEELDDELQEAVSPEADFAVEEEETDKENILEASDVSEEAAVVNDQSEITDEPCKSPDKAPCPLCGQLQPIVYMSEHLDHHTASELQKQFDQEAPAPPQPSTSGTSRVKLNPNGKRAKSKSSNQSDAKKTRSIQTFFTRQ